ncbi:ABC transporter substrate-binding protein [Kineococcus esterisolvens]|uniref:ABC transporter substrate-binding protein n=1 Tax=unclassified Kineococcus TaxID=2621656 RepID=UPI003D7E1EE3
MLQAVTAGALTLSLAACSGGAGEPDQAAASGAEGTAPLLTLGAFVEPTSFAPAAAQEGNAFPYYQAVYDTLIKRAPDGSLEPFLATEWEYDESRTRLTLTLRNDVTFSDGAPFDAEAAKANIEHFVSAGGPQANQAALIESAEVVDATTLAINLSEPDPSLEFSLASALGLMASPDALGSEAIAGQPVGSGPYLLDDSIVGSQYTFVRNDDYWGEQLPYDSVQFMVLTDETARVNALRSGQIDAAVFNSPTTAAELESAGFEVQHAPLNWTGLVYFDRAGALNPALADSRVREAITVAIDKEGLLESTGAGLGEVTNQIFPEEALSHLDEYEGDERFTHDPQRARELLAEAGYADGLTLDMPISPVFPPAVYAGIEQDLADVGITMTRTEFGPGQFIPAILGGKHEVTYMTLAMFNDWTTIQQYVAEDAPWNALGSTDPELSQLIDTFQNASSDEERTQIGQQLNQWLIDNNWFGVFSTAQSTYATDDTVDVELQAQQAVPSIYNYSPAS